MKGFLGTNKTLNC